MMRFGEKIPARLRRAACLQGIAGHSLVNAILYEAAFFLDVGYGGAEGVWSPVAVSFFNRD